MKNTISFSQKTISGSVKTCDEYVHRIQPGVIRRNSAWVLDPYYESRMTGKLDLSRPISSQCWLGNLWATERSHLTIKSRHHERNHHRTRDTTCYRQKCCRLDWFDLTPGPCPNRLFGLAFWAEKHHDWKGHLLTLCSRSSWVLELVIPWWN